MSKKIDRTFIVGLNDGGDVLVYDSKEQLEQGFNDGDFDHGEEIVEAIILKRYKAGGKLDLIEQRSKK